MALKVPFTARVRGSIFDSSSKILEKSQVKISLFNLQKQSKIQLSARLCAKQTFKISNSLKKSFSKRFSNLEKNRFCTKEIKLVDFQSEIEQISAININNDSTLQRFNAEDRSAAESSRDHLKEAGLIVRDISDIPLIPRIWQENQDESYSSSHSNSLEKSKKGSSKNKNIFLGKRSFRKLAKEKK